MIKAVIFDMDGLIVDSEPLQSKALEILLKEYGKTPNKPNATGLIHTVGIAGNESYQTLIDQYQLSADISTLKKKKKEIYTKFLKQKLTPMPGVVKLLELLKKKKIKRALASSRSIDNIFLTVESLGLKHYFDVIAGPDQHTRYKPFPDIYLKAAKELEVSPQNCVVLEDSESGVSAGHTAGMKVIAVPNQYTKRQDFSKADIIVGNLSKVTVPLIQSL